MILTVDLEERLKQMEKDWKDAEPGTGGGAIADGDYQAAVARFDFSESKRDGNLQLITEFEIIAPDYIGRTVKVWHDLENPERLGYAKGHLELLGIELGVLSELEKVLPQALDSVCEITLKSKTRGDKTYQNVYLNRVLGGVKHEREEAPEGTPIDENPPPHTDDDIPF